MKSAEEYKKEGIDFGNNEQYEEAIACFGKCIEINPNEIEAWCCKGAAFTHLGEYEEATNCFDKAIALNPNFSFAYMGKAGALAALGMFVEAEECISIANECCSVDDLVQMSMNYADNEQYDDAFDCITKAIELDPNNGELWFVKGNMLYNFEDYELAAECFDKAEKCGMNPITCLNRQALSLMNDDEFEKAIECCDRAIEFNPNDADIWNSKGRILATMECFQEAFDCLNKAVELSPNNPDFQRHKEIVLEELKKNIVPENLESSLKSEYECMEKGMDYMSDGLYKNANVCFEKATEFNPENDEVWFGKGMSLMFLQRFEDAVNAFDKAICINEKNEDYWRYKGEALNELDRESEALDSLSKSIEINPKYEDGWITYGNILNRRDHYAGALNCYREVIKINPYNVKAWRKIGDILHHELGLHKESIYYYDKVLELKSNDDDTLLMKANALSETDLKEESLKCYDKIMVLNPENEFALENKGTTLKKMGRDREAMECYKEAEKKGTLINNMSFQGMSNFLDSSYEEAVEYFDEEITKNPSNAHAWNMKGWSLVKLGKYEEAAQCYHKRRYNVLDAFLSLANSNIEENIEEKKHLAPFLKYLLQNDDFFISIAEQINDDIEPYMNIYIRIMEIISLLNVDFVNEKLVATYTSEIAVENMLKALWLSLITNSNDPKEGQSLLDYFYNKEGSVPTDEQRKRIEQHFGMFATSFTFNYDHLNQFRLYGRSAKGIEAGGVSLVVNHEFFRTINPAVEMSSIVEKFKSEKGLTIDKLNKSYKDIHNYGDTSKLSLFRCIYIDPKSGFVASLGQREEYTFYQSKEDTEKISSYKKYMEVVLNEVREQLKELKKEIRDLDPEIVSQLLLPLRYLTKDVSFREEQECRIFKVKSLVGDEEVFERLGNYRTNYLGMKDFVKKIILGVECDKTFENEYKKIGIEKVEFSGWKFEDKNNKK